MNIRNLIVAGIIMTVSSATLSADEPVAYVNPFIGTTNFGTTNPGAICPNGLMSVTPFNVMGSNKNVYDKCALVVHPLRIPQHIFYRIFSCKP